MGNLYSFVMIYKPGWILNPGPGGGSVRDVSPSRGSAAKRPFLEQTQFTIFKTKKETYQHT